MIKKNQSYQLGSWIMLNHPSSAEILAGAGFDWLCIDMEHTVTDYFQAQQLIATIQGKGIKPYVRIADNDPIIIKRILDAGAEGIIVPMVNSQAEAQKAVEACFYPPIGKRGVGLARAQGYGFNFDEYKNTTAKDIKVIAQIEHIDAIDDLEGIIKTQGIAGTFIGPYDLSGSLGKPGDYDEPDVKEALERYENIAQKYDKWMGVHVVEPNAEKVLEKVKKGYNFVAFSTDYLFLGTFARKEVTSIKQAL